MFATAASPRTLAVRALTLTVALSLTAPRAKATGGDALAVEDKNNLCALNVELAKYPALVATKLVQNIQNGLDLLSTQLKFQIYIEQRDVQEALPMLPILAALSEKRQSPLAVAVQQIRKGVKASSEAAALSGRIIEGLEMLADFHKEGGNSGEGGCLSASGTTVVLGAGNLGECGNAIKDTEVDERSALTKLTLSGYSDLKGATRGATRRAAANAKCHVLHTAANNGVLNDEAVSNQATLISGYVVLNDGAADYAVKKLDALNADDSAAPKNFRSAYRAFRAADSAGLHAATVFRPITLPEVKSSTAAKAAFKALVIGSKEPYTAADDASIALAMDQKYGDEQNFQSNWYEKAAKNSVSKKASGGNSDETEQLTAVTDINKLQKILAYYTSAKLSAAAEKIKQNTAAQTAATGKATDCTKQEGKGEAECIALGCEHDKENNKCKPKAEEKAEKKDGKATTTNTTGSNSFVIKKAPLLLAVLLF